MAYGGGQYARQVETWRAFVEVFVTLLIIMDPAGTTPVFIALTRQMSPRQRSWAAVRAMLAAGSLIIGFALFGGALLDYLNVSLGSLSVAGGLLLLLVALEMLRGLDAAPDKDGDIALVPLATPLVAGPGAIATVIVLARQRPEAAVISGAVAALVAMAIALLLAGGIARLISPALLHFFTRVFGLLLAAIAVQLVADGVRALATT
jgi:multiple antibiotic resistance protein